MNDRPTRASAARTLLTATPHRARADRHRHRRRLSRRRAARAPRSRRQARHRRRPRHRRRSARCSRRSTARSGSGTRRASGAPRGRARSIRGGCVPRVIGWALGAVACAIVAVPIAAVALGLVVFPIDFVLKMVGVGGASGLVGAYLRARAGGVRAGRRCRPGCRGSCCSCSALPARRSPSATAGSPATRRHARRVLVARRAARRCRRATRSTTAGA